MYFLEIDIERNVDLSLNRNDLLLTLLYIHDKNTFFLEKHETWRNFVFYFKTKFCCSYGITFHLKASIIRTF